MRRTAVLLWALLCSVAAQAAPALPGDAAGPAAAEALAPVPAVAPSAAPEASWSQRLSAVLPALPLATVSAQAVTPGTTDGWLGQLQSVGAQTGQVAGELVNTALGLIGVPYRMGGNSPQTGLDCSGFVRYVYANTLGLVLPRRAAEQARATAPIAKEELRPGDLVFFNTMRRAFSHVGVYLGDGKFIHAPRKGESVKISDMNDRYWARRFNGARRVDALDAAVADVR